MVEKDETEKQAQTLDRLYLEWSQFTDARTTREIDYCSAIEAAMRVLPDWPEDAFQILRDVTATCDGDGGDSG